MQRKTEAEVKLVIRLDGIVELQFASRNFSDYENGSGVTLYGFTIPGFFFFFGFFKYKLALTRLTRFACRICHY